MVGSEIAKRVIIVDNEDIRNQNSPETMASTLSSDSDWQNDDKMILSSSGIEGDA